MRIKIEPKKANIAVTELLELSRTVRRSQEAVQDVQHRLRQLTELETCKRELQKQTDALELITARLVHMSSALREIMETYQMAEGRNRDRLEGCPQSIREPGNVVTSGTDALHSRIQKILYR